MQWINVIKCNQTFESKKIRETLILQRFSYFKLMPQTGIEPVREYKSRRILSPVRLPVPPLRHFLEWKFILNDPEETRTLDLRRDRAAL